MEAVYHNLYVGCGIFSIIMLVVTVVLFFVLNIYKAFMFLSGIDRKRGIRAMEEGTDDTTRLNGKKHSKSKKVMTQTGRIDYAGAEQTPTDANTSSTPVSPQTEARSKEAAQTMEGTQKETEILTEKINETEVLTEKIYEPGQEQTAGETQLLDNEQTDDGFFVMERTIIEIHTEEMME